MGRWIRYVGLTTQERTQEALCLLDDECIMAESTSPLLKMNLRVLYIQEAYRFTLGTNPCDTGCSARSMLFVPAAAGHFWGSEGGSWGT